MKKRMIVMILAFCLALSNGMLVFAVEKDDAFGSESNQGASEQMLKTTDGEGEETSLFVTEAGIAAYEAYVAYVDAAKEKSLENLQITKPLLDNAIEALEQGGDEAFYEDVEKLFNLLLIGEGDDDAFNTVTEFYRMLSYRVEDFIMLAGAYEKYLEEPSLENCEVFLTASNEAVTRHAVLDETLFTPFYGTSLQGVIDEVSETANEYYDEEYTNAKKVAAAYEGLKNTFLYGGDGVILMEVEKLPEKMEMLEALSEEELEELAEYLGADSGKEAYNLVYTRWESVQAFMEFPALYAAYEESGSAEAAEELIACYEKMESSFVMELLTDKYEAVESVMEEAYADVKTTAESAKEETVTKEEPPVTEESTSTQATNESESAPETGDETDLFPFAVLLVGVAALLAMRKSRA